MSLICLSNVSIFSLSQTILFSCESDMNIFSRHSHREIDNKIFIGFIAVWQLRMSLRMGLNEIGKGIYIHEVIIARNGKQ